MKSFILLCWFLLPQRECFGFSIFCYFVLLNIFILSGILICRPILNCYILSSLLKKIGFAYLEFMFLGVLLFFFSRVKFVDVCVIFLVNYRSSLLPKCSVLF